MRNDTPTGRGGAAEADAAERAELARHIDALMAMPPRRWPSIIVLGDEAVFGITPAD
ncbi:hypothetical protein [Phenylobacterium sp.]|jgi:hypothetical protein|uniref:hypothetical protein n=1 Tax=Phenylobacterium sp. TaxID=1871053 RepID=UPI002ED8375A